MTMSEEALPSDVELQRDELLTAGMKHLLAAVGSPIEALEPDDVLGRTNLPSEAFHDLWPSAEDYRRELRQRLGDSWDLADVVERLVGAVATNPENRANSVLQEMRLEVLRNALNPRFWSELTMLAGGHADDIAAIGSSVDDWIDAMAALFGEVIDALDLELCNGCSAEWVTRSIMAIVDGFSIQTRAGIDLKLSSSDDWDSLDFAVASIVTSAVRHKDDREAIPTDVRGAWDRLFTRPKF